ncbi:hypothetical protein [Gimesia aquarii]|uniref:SLA1 homology domain-containing protein n=1 Tax=Gimesia aquarii TaxID=2527964 RepID=A0A517WYW2_9PLAN|nr:hypothetical protein [Gimesia aquarii]QDU10434.1 hypothetical protein V202x_38440 [Gimesia aquarii]
MKRFSFLLITFTVIPILALAETNEGSSSVGRYNIVATNEGLYFLDTATGSLWLKRGHGAWIQIESPVTWKSNQIKQSNKPVTLTLPQEGVTIPMIQRERRKVPGSSGTLSVQLGDITAGQVFVEVVDINGNYLATRTSLKNNEFLKFKLDGEDVYLQIFDMVNNLIGEDICKVRLSFEKPNKKSKKEKPEKAIEKQSNKS